jgi:hypothetical protein
MARRPTLPYVGLFLRYLTYLDENSPYLAAPVRPLARTITKRELEIC